MNELNKRFLEEDDGDEGIGGISIVSYIVVGLIVCMILYLVIMWLKDSISTKLRNR